MEHLLYPAYQKYYSALKCLEKFSVDADFFDNISSLDTFFSEYRSTTLVLQKSIKDSKEDHLKEKYSALTAGIWDPFMNEQRVKSIHQHPVELIKQIYITVYYPDHKEDVVSKQFSIIDDIPFSSLTNNLKDYFYSLSCVEVFFSAKFIYYEKNSLLNIWSKIIAGMETMESFLNEMYHEADEKDELVEELRKKIIEKSIYLKRLDLLLENDYVYYIQKDAFEKASLLSVLYGSRDTITPMGDINVFRSAKTFGFDADPFFKFMIMNLAIKTSDLMPTFLIIYQDGRFFIDMFHSDIKTTFYRKIHNVANIILQKNVDEVFYMATYTMVDFNQDMMEMSSAERIDKSIKEFLTFMKVNKELQELEYVFDGGKLDDSAYVRARLNSGGENKLNFGRNNLNPIIRAFTTIKNQE